MGRVRASVEVAGRVFDAEQLWYDTGRWPSFQDGCLHVQRTDPGWPREPGARVVWDTGQDGRGRVVEQVVSFEQRTGLTTAVEDPRLRGTQTLRFVPLEEGRLRVELELEYALKEAKGPAAIVDLLFIRRPVREMLQRTLIRFARELRFERETA